MSQQRLPEPESAARAHSAALVRHIRAAIAAAGGAVPFSRYMELALYTPGLGYYSAGATKFGAAGDFITAPELGPVFAECVANALAPLLSTLTEPVFLELGGGSGAFAGAFMRHAARLHAAPSRYAILEPSADLRQRQQDYLRQSLPPHLSARCEWLDQPPDAAFNGVLFANEVLDALPTTRFAIDAGEVWEEYVAVTADGSFCSLDRPADAMLRSAVRNAERCLDLPFADGYRSEILPQLPYWMAAVAGRLRQGALLFVDYGYPRREYYLPERAQGTLVCHYRHLAHFDAFYLPGLQDISAFVDFTAVAEAGAQAGFDFEGYCNQSSFLLGNGLEEQIAAAEAMSDQRQRHDRINEIRTLTLPGQMGERFQVIGFGREVDLSAAFTVGDLSRRL